MRRQEYSVDPNGLAGGWFETTLDSCCGGDELGTSKGDAGRDCDLAKEIEPDDCQIERDREARQ